MSYVLTRFIASIIKFQKVANKKRGFTLNNFLNIFLKIKLKIETRFYAVLRDLKFVEIFRKNKNAF
jgi:hypothetical protein